MKRKILFVSHAPRLEGAEKSLLELVVQLRQQGLVEPLVIIPKTGRLQERLQQLNIPHLIAPRYPWWVDHPAWKRWLLGPLKLAWNHLAWRVIRRQVSTFQPDLVYINTLVAPLGWIIARSLSRPMVWHAREFVPEWLGRDFDFGREWALTKVAGSCAVVANSQAVMHSISPYIPEHRRQVVYNGIELPADDKQHLVSKLKTLTQPQAPVLRLLLIGSINHNKDPITAIKAVNALIQQGVKTELRIVGEPKGEYGSQMVQLIEGLGLQQVIHIKGWQTDTAPYYQEAHLTLVTARGEPFGRTIIESMAHYTPVVATDAGGAPEILRPLDPRLLFPPGDHLALAATIKAVINDPTQYQSLAENGRTRVEEQFSQQRYTQGMWEVFSRCM